VLGQKDEAEEKRTSELGGAKGNPRVFFEIKVGDSAAGRLILEASYLLTVLLILSYWLSILYYLYYRYYTPSLWYLDYILLLHIYIHVSYQSS
jgi:hypothetical protein